MNKIFSQQVEQQMGGSASNETNNQQKKGHSRRWRISGGPLIVSSFLTLALLGMSITTAVSGGVEALPAAYSHHAQGKHIQSIVQSQHIVIPAPITPTSIPQSHKGTIK